MIIRVTIYGLGQRCALQVQKEYGQRMAADTLQIYHTQPRKGTEVQAGTLFAKMIGRRSRIIVWGWFWTAIHYVHYLLQLESVGKISMIMAAIREANQGV